MQEDKIGFIFQETLPEIRYISSEAKQFIQSLLTIDPKQRLSASSCLEHPWLSEEGGVDTLHTLETSWMKQLLARLFIYKLLI